MKSEQALNQGISVNKNKQASTNKLDRFKRAPKAYRDIARGLEKQYIQMMLDQMKKTADSSKPDSTATKYYKSLIQDEHATVMSEKNNGLGLQEMILEQIVPNHLKDNINKNPVRAYKTVQSPDTPGVKSE